MLAHKENVAHCGIAGAPVTDWRLYGVDSAPLFNWLLLTLQLLETMLFCSLSVRGALYGPRVRQPRRICGMNRAAFFFYFILNIASHKIATVPLINLMASF